MPPSLLALFALQITAALLLFILAVQGFRTHFGWGCVPLLILLGPFAFHAWHIPNAIVIVLGGIVGLAMFALKHRKRAGILFLLYVGCLGATMALLFTSPQAIAFYVRFNPGFVSIVKTVNPDAYDEAQKLPELSVPGEPEQPQTMHATHEVRDLAESEVVPTPPRADPNAAQRAAYVKHANNLNNIYQQLNAERHKLKAGSPGVAAFNAKATRYQKDVQMLAGEKIRLDALDRASNASAGATLALSSSQATVGAPIKPQRQP